jgi:hypothetical protein
MWRLLFSAVLAGLAAPGAAVSQPVVDPATAAALDSAAFAPRTPDRGRAGRVEQTLGFGPTRPFYLYAGASPAAQQLPEDPRWRANHAAGSANALVNTGLGIGWEHDDAHVSLGYLRRQLPNPGGDIGNKPHRDSMVGLSVSIHPNF